MAVPLAGDRWHRCLGLRFRSVAALPDPSTSFGERVRRRLREEEVLWITTVDQGGIPQPNPVGFVFQNDDSILIYNMVNAKRLSHVVDRPQVSLHFDGDGHGGDIVIFTGTAHRADDVPPPHKNPDYLAKYGDSLLRVSNNAEEFGNKFSVPLRVEITGTRGR